MFSMHKFAFVYLQLGLKRSSHMNRYDMCILVSKWLLNLTECKGKLSFFFSTFFLHLDSE
jgi:hypothetical protein